jgi:hypothetical protein
MIYLSEDLSSSLELKEDGLLNLCPDTATTTTAATTAAAAEAFHCLFCSTPPP